MKKTFSLRTIILTASLLLHLGTFCSRSHAAAGDVDLSFDASAEVNSTVSAIALQPDGKVLVGGPLTFINGTDRYANARLNVDGSPDASFVPSRFNPDLAYVTQNDCPPGFPDPCYTIIVPECSAVQSNGKVLVGGYTFTTEFSADYYRYFVARLHADGSRDTSFEPAIGDPRYWEKETVRTLAVQPDGKVLVGGQFYSIKGTNRLGIARLNANGTLDNSFVPGVGMWPSGADSVASQPDGKVLLGGYSIIVNGTNYPTSIVRLNDNGSLDLGFNRSFSDGAILLQPDGKVLVGLSRLNADGSLDPSFDAGTGANDAVNSIALQPDGKVVAGGAFTRINGTNCNRVARLNTNGSLDGDFQVARGVESPVSQLALQPDGKVLIGGVFTFINGTNRYGSDRLNRDGSMDSTFVPSSFNPDLANVNHNDCSPDFPDSCNTIAVPVCSAVQSNGKVLVGGYTETYYFDLDLYSYRPFVARFHGDGSRDTSFQLAVGNAVYSEIQTVRAIAVQPDGRVVVGGIFQTIHGTDRPHIARLNANGSLDNSFVPGVGMVPYGADSIALQPDGKVLLGGQYFTVNGTNYHTSIVRLNDNGSLDLGFNRSFSGGAIVLQPDGKVLVGLRRLHADGSLDISFDTGTGANGRVRSIALQPDGNVLIGGDFTSVNGVVRPRIARLHGAAAAPSLTIARSNAFVIVSWPVASLSFQLQETTNLALPDSWSPAGQAAVTNAGQISVTVPTSVGRKFFQLQSQ